MTLKYLVYELHHGSQGAHIRGRLVAGFISRKDAVEWAESCQGGLLVEELSERHIKIKPEDKTT